MTKELIDLREFPTTRYQGSKRKILPWIYKNLKEIEFQTVLDACGGTGSVSYLFKKMGKDVVYNDVLKFNHFIGKAIIENQEVRINGEDLDFILDFSEVNDNCNFITQTFDGIYYTSDENKWLDNIIYRINSLQGSDKDRTEIKKAMCFYALFQSSMRKRPFNLFHRNNLYIRTNNVNRNFGNKATWEKDFTKDFIGFVNEVNECIFDSGSRCLSLNKSVFEVENVNYDLVYFDIPYLNALGKNETSDYLKCYHFLEGISNYDEWSQLIDYESRNLRFKEQLEDKPFSKQNIYGSLDVLFEKFQESTIVFSYKIGGIPSVKEIEGIMKRYKRSVVTQTKHYTYALNKQNGNAKYNREVLIIGK